MELTTPTYTRMMQKQKEELLKLKNNDIDVFVNVVNQARREPAEVKMPVSIGWKPEAVAKVKQTEKNKISESHDRGFLGGMLFTVLVVGMIVLLLVM